MRMTARRFPKRAGDFTASGAAKTQRFMCRNVNHFRLTAAAEYDALLTRRDAFSAAWEAFFGDWDALLCPVAMIPAFPHWPTDAPLPVDGTLEPYWRIIGHCGPFNLTGHPVVVIPAGRDPDGLPIGVQVVGPRWGEARLLRIAAAIAEVAGPFQRPPGY